MRGRARPESVEVNRLEEALLHFVSSGYDARFQTNESASEQIRRLARLARQLIRVIAKRNSPGYDRLRALKESEHAR